MPKTKTRASEAPRAVAFEATYQHVASLTPYAKNARLHSPAQIAAIKKSMETFGFTNPVLADADGIVAGHGRVLAATELYEAGILIKLPNGNAIPLGMVPVIDCSGWDQQRRRAYILADNRLSELGSWDETIYREEMFALQEDNFDLSVAGFDETEVARIMATGAADTKGDPEETPEAPENPVSQRGDVWLCGSSRVMCGSSIERADVDVLIGDLTVDIANCDPPYGISVVKVSGGKEKGNVRSGKAYPVGGVGGSKVLGHIGGHQHTPKNDLSLRGKVGGAKPFGKVHGPAKKAMIHPGLYAPIIGDDTIDTAVASVALMVELNIPVIVSWGGNYYANALPNSRCWLVWDKETTGSFADAELAWTNQDRVVKVFTHQWSGLMKGSERGERRVHPTQKPVALAEWVVETMAPEAKVVMDLFLGGGWTLIMAEKRGITCLGMELAPAYVDVAVLRFEKYSGKTAIHEATGLTMKQLAKRRLAKPAKRQRSKAA